MGSQGRGDPQLRASVLCCFCRWQPCHCQAIRETAWTFNITKAALCSLKPPC